jgi:hypothetical protein
MSDGQQDLSSRYYAAEAMVWLVAIFLFIARFVGLGPAQSLPIVDVAIARQEQLPRLTALLLCLVALYMVAEWTLSRRSAKARASAKVRFALTLACASAAIWIWYPVVVAGTRLFPIAPSWVAAFVVYGLLLGGVISLLIDVVLMIRTVEESKRIQLPRIPVASHAQLVVFLPALILLLALYYPLRSFAPAPARDVSLILTSASLVAAILHGTLPWFFPRDADGNRTTFAARKATLRGIYDKHDYQSLLAANADTLEAQRPVRPASPQEMQRILRKHITDGYDSSRVRFRVVLREELRFRPFAKDRDRNNDSSANRGIRVYTATGERPFSVTVEVCATLTEGLEETKVLELPVELVESCAEEYVAGGKDWDDVDFHKLASHALNESVRRMLAGAAPAALYQAAMAGDGAAVKEIIALGAKVNERSEFGWTALIAAAAQGHVEILEDLLLAGADPDIANLQDVTPLMYGARYGNADVCRTLIEHGADVNLPDLWGSTALIIAAAQGQDTILDALLAAGADPALSNKDSKTALQIAQELGKGEIAKKLRAAMGQSPPNVHSGA